MRRELELPVDGCIESVDTKMIEIDFGSTLPERALAELSLLQEGLVDALTLRHHGSEFRIRVRCGAHEDRAIASWENDFIAITVSRRELAYWQSFFLKYYRDGMAEVDHIDIEASNASETSGRVDIVLKVRHAQPPVSAEEARRRLGL